MKKTLIPVSMLIFCAVLLTACGNEKHEPTVVIETPAPVVETSVPGPSIEVQNVTSAPEESALPEDTGIHDEKYQTALGFVGKIVEELYDAIGYPEYQDYGPSCLGKPGSEDGQLDYEGFSVFTLVEDGVETVVDVLRDGEF